MKKLFYRVSMGLIGLALSVPEKTVATEDDIKDQYCSGILNGIKLSLKEVKEDLFQVSSWLEQVYEERCCCGNTNNFKDDANLLYQRPIHEIGVDLISQWK